MGTCFIYLVIGNGIRVSAVVLFDFAVNSRLRPTKSTYSKTMIEKGCIKTGPT